MVDFRKKGIPKKDRKPDIQDLIIWLKYGELPSLSSPSLTTKSYALMLRGMYIQENKSRMYKVHQIIKDVDYEKALSLSSSFNLTLPLFLLTYFSWMGLGKEFQLYVEENAETVINILGKRSVLERVG